MLTRLLICAAMGAARLGELAWSKRNLDGAAAPVEGELSRQTYPLMVALHTVTIVGTALFGARSAHRPFLALLLLAQVVRIWTLGTLGRRWNTRGAVASDIEIETGGPYQYVRHPNYAVVAVELASLPAAFGLWRLAFASTVANALLLLVRIRDEERLLRNRPGWTEHFERLKRFVPGVF